METLILNLDNVNLNDQQFYHLCLANKDWKIERNKQGELIIMSPVGGISGKREADLITDLNIWNRQTNLGIVFSSSTIFALPNGGDRSPDVAWVSREKWENLTASEKTSFPPICPDFVIELRSATDKITPLREKMQEYLSSGLALGWLINPQDQEVEIYRLNQPVEIIKLPAQLNGDNILPGFILNLSLFA